MPAIALVVEIETVPGRREAFLARLGQHRARVLAEEPGCRQFDVLVGEESDDVVVLYEVYEDRAALEAHGHTAYFQAYRADTDAMIARRRRLVCAMADWPR